MVIGNGLLAKRFSFFREDESVVIFASGVSNSNETDQNLFDREIKLLSDTITRYQRAIIVYFSTCSVYDPELSTTPYVLHKLKIETIISGSAASFLILRLPQVVGGGGNKNTLFNYLYSNIKSGTYFEIWKKARRYLIDIDDVFTIADHLIKNRTFYNRTINVALYQYSIFEIVHSIEKAINTQANCTLVDKGASYRINTDDIKPYTDVLQLTPVNKYLQNIIKKYYTSKSQFIKTSQNILNLK